MKKSLLMITPFFAPQTHAAVFRAFKLAKYLPRFGWDIHVVTVDVNYMYNEDVTLLGQLPENVHIHKARYVEPTLRGLRMALGGKDRSFKSLKNSKEPPATPAKTSQNNTPYVNFLKNHLQVPDAYRTWIRPATQLAKNVARKEGCKIVYTTCVPYSCNVVGAALQREGLKWAADFRDAPTFCFRTHSDNQRIFAKQRKIERDTLVSADVTTGLSSTYNLIFSEMYNLPPEKEMIFIPTGVDDDYIPYSSSVPSAPPAPYIIFVGEYLKEYSPYFFELYSAVSGPKPKILVVGNKLINTPILNPIIEKYKLHDQVEILDHINQKELYGLIQRANAGILLSGPTRYWWTNFAKLVDYVGLEKPVLASVPALSESRRVLSESNLGVFLNGNKEQDKKTMMDFFAGKSPLSVNKSVAKNYLASEMAKSFDAVLEKLLS